MQQRDLKLISDPALIQEMALKVIEQNPKELSSYKEVRDAYEGRGHAFHLIWRENVTNFANLFLSFVSACNIIRASPGCLASLLEKRWELQEGKQTRLQLIRS